MAAPMLCLSTLVTLLVTAHSALLPQAPTAQPGWCSGIKNEGLMASMTTGCSRGNYRPNFANGAMPQATASPYTIVVEALGGSTYSAGQNVSVIIKPTSAAVPPFKGFFIRGDCSEATFAGDLQCTNAQETHFCYTNGSTHLDCTDKLQVECTWTAPAYSIGKVQFQATIIQDAAATKYWTGVLSANALDAAPGMISYAQNTMNIQKEYMNKFTAMQQQAQQMMTQMKSGNQGNMMQNMQRMMNMMKGQQYTQGNKPAATPAANPMMAQFAKMMAGVNNQQAAAKPTQAANPQMAAIQQMMKNFAATQQQPKPKPQPQQYANPQMAAMQQMMKNFAAPQQKPANNNNQMRTAMNQMAQFGRAPQWRNGGEAQEAQETNNWWSG